MTAPLIADVSDTARWVAAYRARESARPDALFRDPLAARLAGDRGQRIARALARPGDDGWPLVTRTQLIDQLVTTAVAGGCDCVLDLAAGFDTRPYRLPLPRELRWIEADLPALIDEKERALAGEAPRCRVERHRVDLSDAEARAALFDRVDAAASRVLVITEGLVIYLDEPTVAALARDILARPHFAEWVLDFPSPAMLQLLRRGRGESLANAPLRFAPAGGLSFFESRGWRGRDVYSLFHEGVRLRRVPRLFRPFAWIPPPNPRAPGNKRWAGVVRLTREPARA